MKYSSHDGRGTSASCVFAHPVAAPRRPGNGSPPPSFGATAHRRRDRECSIGPVPWPHTPPHLARNPCPARLARAVEPVSGIAEARDDIPVIVEALVHRGGVDLHIGMVLLHAPDPF